MPLGAGGIQPLLPGSIPDLLIVWQISPTAWLVPQKDWEALPQNSKRQTSWSLSLQLSLEYGWAACLPGETALCWALWMLGIKRSPGRVRQKRFENTFHKKRNSTLSKTLLYTQKHPLACLNIFDYLGWILRWGLFFFFSLSVFKSVFATFIPS